MSEMGLVKNAPKDPSAVVTCHICLGKGKGFKAVWVSPEIVFICPRCQEETFESWASRIERPPPCDQEDTDA